MRKRGRPSTKKKDNNMSPETMGLPESGGALLVSATTLFPVALECDTLEPDNGPRKRGRKPKKKKNDMSTESVGLAESGGCGSSVPTIASESAAPERNDLDPNKEADEPDNRSPRKRGRPPKKNDGSCLAESGGCGSSVPMFVSESMAPDRNNLEPNNEGDQPDNRPRKRGRPKKMSPETIVPMESSGRGLSVSSPLPSVLVALENESVEKERNMPDTMPKRLGRPPKSKPMLAADETPTTSKCEPVSVSATARESTGKPSGRPPNSGEKTDNGEPESAGATAEKTTGKRLGRPPKDSGKKKDTGDSESWGTTVEKSTAYSGEMTDNGEPDPAGATTEKKMGKRLGRAPKNPGKEKDKGEPESGGTAAEKSTVERRGRPRKTEPESTGATTEKKTGKRLGRPPKNSVEKKDEGEPNSVMATAEESTSKRRGRPPKTKTDTGEPVFATRKRLGRPPKNSGEKTIEEKTGEQKPEDLVVEPKDLPSL
ncbi:HMG-Y-related protein A-like [Iris pallida]|nr:HMG-Y-related protein A-like [Iris pallida]